MNNATVSCDETDLRYGAKLYWQYSCDRIWLTLEKKNGRKIVLDEMPVDLFGYTYRLGYYFSKEYEKHLLFRSGCPANGACNFILVNKETGKIEKEFGELIYNHDTDTFYDFVLYFDYKSNTDYSIIAEFIDTNRKFEIPVNSSYLTEIHPEYQFEKVSYENQLISLTYNDKGRKRKLTIDTRGKIEKRFEKYLSKYEIKPLVIIKNESDGGRNEGKEVIKISANKFTWFHSLKENKIKINDDLISLENKSSLNTADDGQKIDGYMLNNWDEVKFYNVKGRKLITISMYHDFCTGLMCSVGFYLVYDLQTKSKNFFGTFKTDSRLALYDFERDETVDYLSKTYKSNCCLNNATNIQNIYNLYKLNKKGKFGLQRDAKRNPYFIKRTFDADTYVELETKFKQNWIEKIKMN